MQRRSLAPGGRDRAPDLGHHVFGSAELGSSDQLDHAAALAGGIELHWAGPSPANHIPGRRIDRALYDLIARAKREILLVTFAAAKIGRLSDELLNASRRCVRIRLILEFEETSEGQLSYDAVKAFPSALTSIVEVYQWPVEKRGRNQAGRPGKLRGLKFELQHLVPR
jgi:phosphatidylserine/phosphatidylglycerophosphate/cardiolipin synthase-like enzyme